MVTTELQSLIRDDEMTVIQLVDIVSVSSNVYFCIEMACTLLIRHLLLRQTGNMMNVSSFYSFFFLPFLFV